MRRVTAAAGASAAACKPALTVLGALPGAEAAGRKEGVRDLGRGALSVGSSRGKPVYWTGTTVHRVPMQDGRVDGAPVGTRRTGPVEFPPPSGRVAG
ncbi:hypothetical protein [Streptomyces goshikiensis]|uniref:hypothetical protein n=1 Tax=Streptomyces goshikiensis TaxID=1942 RepID=UPI00371C9719